MTWRQMWPVRTVQTGGQSVVNWLARSRPATRAQTVCRFLLAFPKPATVVRFAPFTLKTQARPATSAGRLSFDLDHRSHIITAAVDAGGTGSWSDPNNITAAPQGTRAGSAQYSGGLVLGASKLRGTMVAQANRGPLIIDAVYLRYHYETSGLPLVSDLISNLALGFRINTAPLPTSDHVLHSVSSNEERLVAGREIRIDNGAGAFVDALSTPLTWANVGLVQPYFGATTIANGLMAYYADAIRLRVVAHYVY